MKTITSNQKRRVNLQVSTFFLVLLVFQISSTVAQSNLTYPVVDTKQVTFYNNFVEINEPAEGEAFYGQDAQYTGNTPSYEDNGDGTVSDLVTGLMWQKTPDLNGDGIINVADKLSYFEALAAADTFSLAGYDDWRLPSIKEMYSLIIFSGIDPSGYEGNNTDDLVPFIDTDYFGFAYGDTAAGERIIDAQMASSTLYVGTTMNGDETMFGVNFADGRIKGYGTGPMPGQNFDKKFYVMYVRGNTSYGENNFVDNGDGTITDNATGLMWMKNDDGEGMVWEDALSYADTSEFANHSDWRLPNVKELQSIVDYSRSPSTSNSAAIDPMFNCSVITDEGGEDNFPFYWSGTTHSNWSTNTYGAWGAYVCFGSGLGFMEEPPFSGNYVLMDVHGAGAQRSDPKMGDPNDYPHGNGPQGDVVRIYNYVRLVRDASISGVGEFNQMENNLKVYPNPASDYINVNTTAFSSAMRTLKIVDLLGAVVYFKSEGLTSFEKINIQSLNPGIYFLTIENKEGIFSKKFIKK